MNNIWIWKYFRRLLSIIMLIGVCIPLSAYAQNVQSGGDVPIVSSVADVPPAPSVPSVFNTGSSPINLNAALSGAQGVVNQGTAVIDQGTAIFNQGVNVFNQGTAVFDEVSGVANSIQNIANNGLSLSTLGDVRNVVDRVGSFTGLSQAAGVLTQEFEGLVDQVGAAALSGLDDLINTDSFALNDIGLDIDVSDIGLSDLGISNLSLSGLSDRVLEGFDFSDFSLSGLDIGNLDFSGMDIGEFSSFLDVANIDVGSIGSVFDIGGDALTQLTSALDIGNVSLDSLTSIFNTDVLGDITGLVTGGISSITGLIGGDAIGLAQNLIGGDVLGFAQSLGPMMGLDPTQALALLDVGGLQGITSFASGAAGVETAAAGGGGGCPNCACVIVQHMLTRFTSGKSVLKQHEITRSHISSEFSQHENFLLTMFYRQFLLPSWMAMTEQISTSAMGQVFSIGTFMDARSQIRSERLMQEKVAEAHKDYHPSVGMCKFGTSVRGLAAAERNSEYGAFVLSQRSQDRQMGQMNSIASDPERRSGSDDSESRMSQFKIFFCDPSDMNSSFNELCGDAAGGHVKRMNSDIDFMGTVAHKGTIDADFLSGGTPAQNQERTNLLALANNLYADDVLARMSGVNVLQPDSQDEILDMRSLIAKRAVTENSFNMITGMKMPGPASAENNTAPFLEAILKELGVTNDLDLKEMLGDRPSYDAQMKVLTKMIYQSPDFYTNLYDKPANVARKNVAMQAIGLMQDFDTWNSYLRTEAILSVILEMELERAQDQVQEQIDSL